MDVSLKSCRYRRGQHQIRVRVKSEDGSSQQTASLEIVVTASASFRVSSSQRLALAWQATNRLRAVIGLGLVCPLWPVRCA